MNAVLFSNSSTKTWRRCRREYWWRYLALGHGIEGLWPDEDLLYGTSIHEVLPLLWKDTALDVIRERIQTARMTLQATLEANPGWEPTLALDARSAKAQEWGRLCAGHLWGIQRTVLPFLQARYTLVAAEADAVRWLDAAHSAGLLAKQDTLLYPKEGAEALDPPALPGLGYVEWKTTAIASEAWHKSFVRNPQSWTGALTLQASLGAELEWFQVVGLVKGVERDGRRSTPLAWAYRCVGPTKVAAEDYWDVDSVHWRADYTAAKGWERVSSDTYPGGMEAWIAALPADVLNSQFAMTEAVDIEWDLAEEWLANQQDMIDRVRHWHLCVDNSTDGLPTPETRMRLFPRDGLDGTCLSGTWGKKCGVYDACHNPEVAAEPLAVYRKRVPHHPLELAQLGVQS